MTSEGSVTRWLVDLQEGDDQAAQVRRRSMRARRDLDLVLALEWQIRCDITNPYASPTLESGMNHWKSHAGLVSPPPVGDCANQMRSRSRNICT